MRKSTVVCISLSLLLGLLPGRAQYNPFEESSSYKSYSYKYLDANFEKQRKEALEKKSLKSLQNTILESLPKTEDESLRSEKWVQIGILAKDQGHFHSSSFFFLQAAEKNIGNKVGEFALYQLSDLLLNSYHLEDEYLLNFFSVNFFDGMHSEVQSMSNYYRARYFQNKDFKSWAKTSAKNISNRSAWFYRIKLKALLYDVLEGGEEFPFEKLRSFYMENKESLGKLDLNNLYLISARFLFEQGEFEKAFSVYQTIKPYSERLKGQILLEMAWAKHYSQDYSHALGLIKLLEAPYFDISLSTERYLLEVLIYRELCHYEMIKPIENKFTKRFAPAFKSIKKRFGHSSNLILANMSLLEEDLTNLSQSFIDLNKEIKIYGEYKSSIPDVLRRMSKRKRSLEKSLEKKVKSKIPGLMNHLLLAKQEMGYLSYVSQLDSMRSKSSSKKYEAEKIEKYKFDKLFWRTNGEFWLDELDDFRVLINSKCGEGE